MGHLEKSFLIGVKNDLSKSGEIVLYPKKDNWGPIISGSTLEEVKAKFKKAFMLSLIAKTYFENCDGNGEFKNIATGIKEKKDDLDRQLESLAL